MAEKDAVVAQPAPEPVAWLCEFQEEDGSTRRQFVEQNPEGLRWNDAGVPSPFMTIPLYAHPPTVTLPPLPYNLGAFDSIRREVEEWHDQIVASLKAEGVGVKT